MRKRFIMLLAACCLMAALSVSACALEYTFDSPSTGDFGTPTSAGDIIRERENPNTDKSKNSALIPPGFGTPTSYLPNSGEFLTPNLAADGPLNSPSLMASAGGANTSGGAEVLPGPVGSVSGTPPTFAASSSGSGTASTSGGYTEVTEDSYYRTYAVTSVSKISETDNSMLESTSENCITLFTCVRDQREYRWCVRAVEI